MYVFTEVQGQSLQDRVAVQNLDFGKSWALVHDLGDVHYPLSLDVKSSSSYLPPRAVMSWELKS